MKHFKIIVLSLLLLYIPSISLGAPKLVENIYPKVCKEGLHTQPNGEFAAYVFCDDAAGSNIAVVHLHPGDSIFQKWPLSKRFWQSEPWSLDVTSIGWVPNKNFLVVATSEIYGEGAVFLLDLENQKSTTLLSPQDCGSEILAINQITVTVGLNDCEKEKPYKKVVIKLPHLISHSNETPYSTP